MLVGTWSAVSDISWEEVRASHHHTSHSKVTMSMRDNMYPQFSYVMSFNLIEDNTQPVSNHTELTCCQKTVRYGQTICMPTEVTRTEGQCESTVSVNKTFMNRIRNSIGP